MSSSFPASPLASRPLGLFQGYGVELEYMLVDRQSLNVRPICDEVFARLGGEAAMLEGEYVPADSVGGIGYSNELVLHVIEMKTMAPAPQLSGLATAFQGHVQRLNHLLADLNAMLLPTAMHPWMDPQRETRLWPHGSREIYDTFNRVFDCRGHGWSNLQSTHLNLSFHGPAQFGALHAAIRLVLPLLPALAASSPLQDGRVTGLADSRLAVYHTNCARIPQVTGRVVPEPVFTPQGYREQILEPMYAAIAPFDPEGILQQEWLNARGAIARFERGSIEIRVLDIQEHPAADLAVLDLVVAVIQALVNETLSERHQQQAVPTAPLTSVLEGTIRHGQAAEVLCGPLLEALGLSDVPRTTGEVWRHLARTLLPLEKLQPESPLSIILRQGTLATRIRKALGDDTRPEHLASLYRTLADCLERGKSFAV